MAPAGRRNQTLLGRNASLLVGCAAVLTAALWVVFTATRSQPVAGRFSAVRLLTVDRPFPSGGRYASDPYVGPKVCSECHPGEAALHSRSGHASTLRPAARLDLARRLDGTTVPDPVWPEFHWSYQFRDGQLLIARNGPDQVEQWRAAYAFRSGRHATTFVSMGNPQVPKILEHRLTYYTSEGALGITPGQDMRPRPKGPTPHGVGHSHQVLSIQSDGEGLYVLTPRGSELWRRAARECFGCHTTQLSARDDQRLDEETMIPNVSCERCHGPGRAHVAAARRGAPESDLALPFGPDRWTAESLLKLCGSCHRHPSLLPGRRLRPDDPSLVRFQPVGLMQSMCYRKSGGALSCVNCHDSHARASTNRVSYDSVCLSCHAGRGQPAPPADPARAAGAPCPVSPRARCVECHMPRVEVLKDIVFSDHWIRVRRPGGLPSRPGAPAPAPDLLDPPKP